MCLKESIELGSACNLTPSKDHTVSDLWYARVGWVTCELVGYLTVLYFWGVRKSEFVVFKVEQESWTAKKSTKRTLSASCLYNEQDSVCHIGLEVVC